jgi:NADH:ubiquinone oxidoreductase subunit 4 (subunit M)
MCFLVHLWLLTAQDEAPLPGSVILPGVFLKLRVLVYYMFLSHLVFFSLGSVSVSIGLVGGLICIRQPDFKLLIACSSVAHTCILSSKTRN